MENEKYDNNDIELLDIDIELPEYFFEKEDYEKREYIGELEDYERFF